MVAQKLAKNVQSMAASKLFRWNITLFIVFLAVLYGILYFAKDMVPFELNNYTINSHHYQTIDAPEKSSDLLYKLAVYDANFYLNIAANGYADHPSTNAIDIEQKSESIGLLSYAFAPGFPLLVGLVNSVIRDIYISAFITTVLLAIACFMTVWWVVAKWYGEPMAMRVTWLVMTLPAAFFLYTYYAESLAMIGIALLLDAYRRQSPLMVASITGLLAVTRFSTIILVLVFTGWLAQRVRQKNMPVLKAMGYAGISILPLALWSVYCAVHAGDPLIFLDVRSCWHAQPGGVLTSMASFFSLPLHHFHVSKLDVVAIIVSGVMLYYSRSWLPRSWWYVALGLWAFPLVTTDTMSAMRYQLLLLPLYIWLAHALPKKAYALLLAVNIPLFLFVSILAVQYWWIG